MKWNVDYTLKGPGGSTTIPDKRNPIDGLDIASVLSSLSHSILIGSLKHDLTIIGVNVELAEEEAP